MSALGMTLGQLAGNAGEAYTQQREFNLKQQQVAAQAALAQAQAGEAQQRGQYYENVGQRDKYQPLTPQPVWSSADNKWVMPMRNIYDANEPIKYVEMGAPASSIDSVFGQLKRNGVDFAKLSPEVQQMVFAKYVLGSASAAYAYNSPTEIAGANGQPQVGMVNRITNTVVPSGGAAVKPVQNNYQTVVDNTGNQVLTTVPRYNSSVTNPAAAVAAAPGALPTPPPSVAAKVKANGQQAVPPAAPQSGATSGRPSGAPIKKLAMMDTEAANTLQGFSAAQPMLTDLLKTLKDSGRQDAGRGGLTDILSNKAETFKNYTAYKAGIPVDPFYQKAFALADLYRNLMTGSYLHGIRRGDLIEKIQQHMPMPTDTPAQMYDKAMFLQELNPQIENAIIGFEKQKVKGVAAFPSALPTPPDSVNQVVNPYK